MPYKDCKVKKFTVIEHDTVKTSTSVAEFFSCDEQEPQEFTAETSYYNNQLFNRHDNRVVGFTSGTSIKTGDSNEVLVNFENGLPSGGDFSYQITTQFFFSDKDDEPKYKAKDSIVVQGSQFYDNTYQNGELSVPTKWAIVGGTGKYKHATGRVKATELGCLPISEEDQRLISKYEYKFKVYLPKC